MKITLDISEELSDAVSLCFIGVNENDVATIKNHAALLAGHNEDILIVEPGRDCYWESEEM